MVHPPTHPAILRFVFLGILVALLVGASTVSAQGGAPDTPDRPTGTAIFIGGIDLEWNDVSGADSYEVQQFTNGQWTLLPANGVEIAFYGAGAIISELDPAETLWLRVRARNAHGSSDWSNYFQLASTGQYEQGRQPRPDNVPASGAPIINGTTQIGETLTVDTSGIEDPNGLARVQFRFQWISSNGGTDTVITNATDSTYTPVATDEGNTVKVRVDFVDRGGYSESLTSTATSSVTSAVEGSSGGETSQNSPATGAPTISGTARVGETLTADTLGIADSDGLTNVSYSYQWISNDGNSDSVITDATNSSYTLVAADEGKTIRVRVDFTDDAGNAETRTSASTSSVAARPNNQATGAPTINGTAQVGETFTADTSGIADSDGLTNVSYSYQWISNDGNSDSVITDATNSSYTLVAADEGKTIKVRVDFTDDAGNSETLTSATTGAVARAPLPVNPLVPASDDLDRNVRIADAGSLPGALNVFWLNGDSLGSVAFDRYVVAWKSGDEEFQTDLDGDRVKVVMGRAKDRVIIEGLTNGTEYTVRVTHANSAGPAQVSSREATATPAPRVRELVSSASQSPGIAKPELFSVRGAPGFLFGLVQFTTGPTAKDLGSVTFLPITPLHVGGHPKNLAVELHLYEDANGSAPALIGTFVSPPEYVDGPAKFVAPGDGFALSASTSYWLKLALVQGEMRAYVTRHGDEDPTGQPGWTLLDDCRLASLDTWPYTRSCTTETDLSHGPFLMSLNSPVESTLPLASISGGSAVEGDEIEFTVELSSAPSAAATVQYDTVDGSGDLPATTIDSDYTAVSGGTITFAAGETSKTITVATGDDSIDENNERFLVRLSGPSANIALSELDSAAGVIINNDQTTSSDSTLAGITLTDQHGNTIALNETFDPLQFVYTADADASVDKLNLSVSFDAGVNPHYIRYFDAIGQVKEGKKTQAGSAGFSRIEPGLSQLKVLVTSNDRRRESLYKVMVTRTASSDSTIATLVLEDNNLNDFVLSPAFSPSVTEYTATVANNPPYYADVGLNHGGADAEVSVNGAVVIPYSLAYPADTFDMPAGENTIAIEVTAEDGTIQTYTFTLAPPATPSRPTIESAVHNSVTIAWNDPGDSSITGYQVLRRTPAIHGPGVFDVIEDDTGNSDTSYEDTTVAPETKYVYRVKARNAHGLSGWSRYRSVTTPAEPTPANTVATGLPTIAGTPQVGETLTADPSGISDTNGLINVQFAYKWMRNGGTSDEDIPGATGQTHTLTDDDSGQPGGLFYEVDGDPPPSNGVDALESRLAGIDLGQLSEVTKSHLSPKGPVTGQPPTSRKLILNLFDDAVFTGIVEHVEPTASGHALWGRLDGVELGTMTMVVNGKVVVGTVRTPNEVYSIRTAGDGMYVIRQIDESSLPPLGDPLEVPLSPRDTPQQSDDVPSDDGSVIDVMVVYTPLSKHREGGRAAIEALIDLFVAETNQAYANSGVIHRIRLVLREEVDYVEDGDSLIDLGRLRNGSDGHTDHVHERRDLYAADLVHIVVGRGVVGGLAWLIRSESATNGEALGFGLTHSRCGGLCFAHELGHNMGLGHDRYSLGVTATGSHYGYVNQRMFEPGALVSARWRTIMAYVDQCTEVGDYSCTSVPYFSNPELTYNGDPMGVPVDHPSTGVDGPADAVGSLNERRQITANFRRSPSSPTPRVGLTMSQYWLAENEGVSTVKATLHRPSSADTVVTVTVTASDAVSIMGSGTLTILAGEAVSSGTVTITGVDNNEQTGDTIVEVSATAANTSSLGVTDPEPVELAIVDDETTPVVTLSLSPSEIAEHSGRAFLTAMLDNRSSADTTVSVSAEPAEIVSDLARHALTIPAGQTRSIGLGVLIRAVDNDELADAAQTVTVSGTAENPQGVAGPANATLSIIDDEAPYFAADSIVYTFTAGIAGGRFLPEAAYGNGELTYSLSPAPSSEVTFSPLAPAWIGIPSTIEAGREMSLTLTATDADGDTDTMTISITVREGVCPDSAAVSGHSDPGIVHDCEALLVSRDVLSVNKSLNWAEDIPIDEWEGVKIADGRVVGLHIDSDSIGGTMPSELGSLASLQFLSLNQNRLTGGVPKELGGLVNLRSLSLSRNRLTGEIPTEFGSLQNLHTLDLASNQLTGTIPTELGNLSNLQQLYLTNNQLTGEIPAELGNLSNLQWLELSANRLTGRIPRELGNLSNLQQLYLRNNQLTGEIPAELGNLSNLQWLGLSGNRLTGCVPDELRDVPNNDFIWLGLPFCSEHPCVSGGAVPDATADGLLSDCGTLLEARDTLAGAATLNWSADTPITDWTGVVVGEASGRVTELRLSGMSLDGEIPNELGSLANLESLDLSDNLLTGIIPGELVDLSNLQELYLGGNSFTGCVPDGLRDVPTTDIAMLDLTYCSEHPCVSGGAVEDATNHGLRSDCETLLAARNMLAGTAALNWSAETPIAEWTGVVLGGTHGRVTELNLGSSDLNGAIPQGLSSLEKLTRLILSDNQLTGEIPKELGSLVNLQGLFLWGNRLTGEIPTELENLSDLNWLNLSNNQLTGEIPTELGSLPNLQWLDLWGNQLTGEIPTELENLSDLNWLSLSNNQLTGEIPAGLGSLTNLKGLVLWNNQLTGEIPAGLGNLSNLLKLGLSYNQLTGEIPTELGRLSNLTELALNNNNLEGSIPASLGSLSDLELVYLSSNRFTGCVPPRLRDVPKNDFDLLRLPFCPLSPPEAPTIVSVTTEMDSFTISWVPPLSDGGSDITAYDLRYIETDDDETVDSNWTVVQDAWTIGKGALEYTLTGLTSGTLYDIQVRAVNAEGEGPWSETATGTPTSSACVAGGSVTDATNTGLISDCEALLAARDTLATTGSLNWSSSTPITQWEGITVRGAPARVAWLNIRGAGLGGSVPAELSQLSGLTYLNLRNNGLSGPIPTELGDLTNLRYLGLNNNELSGPIPDLSGMTNLEQLYLSNNDLEWMGTLTEVRELWLWGNQLEGPIPDLSGMTGLVRLKLQSNNFTGGIPTWFGDMTDLVYLYLHENSLTGNIPSELGDMGSLRYLWLHTNELEGGIPPELGKLSNLWDLNLHSNGLTGVIPAELGGLTNLTHLRLHRNMVNGEIPAELGDLESLRFIWLHGNMLSGEIPSELGGLSKLQRLYLSENLLTGDIPGELDNLADTLTHWRLAGNQFTGCVPAGLADVQDTDLDSLGLQVCANS